MASDVAVIKTEPSSETWGLTLAGLSHFAIELCHNFLPVLYPLLIVGMGLSYQQIGYLALIVGLATSLPQPFLGFLTDRFGAYRVSGLSILWLGVLMSLVGLAPNYILLALLIGLASLGSASFHPAGAVLAASNSRARRGMGMSVFSVGGNFGSALSPLLIAVLLPWFGLNAALILLPIALLVGVLLYRQDQPEASNRKVAMAESETASDVVVIGLVLLTVAAMTRAWFQVSLMTYLPTWIESEGGTLAQAGQYLSVVAFSIGAGSMLGGTFSDRVGPWFIVILSFILTTPAYWFFLNTTGAMQMLMLALIGLSIGATYPTFILMAHDCWQARTGTASGLIMGIGWAPGGLGASFTGYLADGSSLVYSLQFLLVPPIIGLVCMVLWRFLVRRA